MPPSKSRLDSWKAIADYLGREVRTVIRWEKEKSLPVHRVPGGRRRAVLAYTEEIDAWLAADRETTAEPAEPPTETPKNQSWSLSSWKLSVGLMILVVGFALLPVLTSHARRSPLRLSTVLLKGNKLVAFNEHGGISWGLDIPSTPMRLLASQVVPRNLVPTHKERVLISLRMEPEDMRPRSDEVQLLSATGKRMWRLLPQVKFHFGPTEVGPPWRFQDWSVVNANGKFLVAVAMGQPKQKRSLVLLADDKGRVAGRYVHSGRITTLQSMRDATTSLLLAGGISQSANSAALAVLDVNHFRGSSPEPANSDYSCDDCSPGRPLRYFTFPRSELNRFAGLATNRVIAVEVSDRGIEIRTAEANLFGETAEAVYEFSRDLNLVGTSFNDAYWHVHRELELTGKISHSKDECPERFGPPLVRNWDEKNGWSLLRVPAAAAEGKAAPSGSQSVRLD